MTDYYSIEIEQNGLAMRELGELVNYTDSNFTPVPYEVPRSIYQAHNQPRWGKPNDFDALVEGGDQTQEYVLGVIIGAMIILIVAMLWFFAIVCLKIVGQERVGFLAGRMVRPCAGQSRGADENDERGGVEVVMEDDQALRGSGNEAEEAVPVSNGMNDATNNAAHVDKMFERRVWAVRGMFVLSGIVVLISGILFYTNGVHAFKNSIDEVRNGIDLVQAAAYKGINLAENVLAQGSRLEEERQPSQEVNESRGGNICGLDSEVSTQIRTGYDLLTSNIDEVTNMVDDQLQSFSHDLKSLVSLTEDINNSLDTADIFLYILVAISCIIIVLIVAMLVGVFFAWKGVSNCLTRCIQYAIIWPLFIFFLILCWIFATLFLVSSLAGADFCIEPDRHVQTLLNKNDDQFDGIIFGFIIFYVSGCQIIPSGFEDMVEISNQLKTVMSYAHDFTQLLAQLPVEGGLQQICGLTEQEATAVNTLANVGHETIHVLNRAFVGLRDVLSCETFNPIYTTFVHRAFCEEGVSGLTYIFSTTLVISIFSMVMIMFRAALYPVKEPNDARASKSGLSGDEMEVVKYDANAAGVDSADGDAPVIY